MTSSTLQVCAVRSPLRFAKSVLLLISKLLFISRFKHAFSILQSPFLLTLIYFFTASANASLGTVFSDDFETNQGWIVNPNNTDTATVGLWERAIPQATNSSGPKQLSTTVSGIYDLVTGSIGGSSNDHDIDGGATSIQSPSISLPAVSIDENLEFSFSYYFAHSSDATTADYFRVSVVTGTGTTLVYDDQGSTSNVDGKWTPRTINLDAFAGQTIQLFIEAAGSGPSLNEAAVDDVVIETVAAIDYVFNDDFETDQGWIVNPNNTDTATEGLWERGNPESTGGGMTQFQLGGTISGLNNLVTGAAAGGTWANNDIDGGVTSVRSPDIVMPMLSGSESLELSLSYYFAFFGIASVDNYLRVTVVGTTNTVVYNEQTEGSEVSAIWETLTANLDNYAGQTVYLLIEASDVGPWNVVEAAIENVEIIKTGVVDTSGSVFSDDFESDLGWVVNPLSSDTATKGMWERGDPSLVEYYGVKQPGDTVSGTHGLITGPQYSANAGYGTYDIDGGVTSIRSPDIALPTLAVGESLELDYDFFFSHNHNKSTADDYLKVTVVGASGSTVVQEEQGLNMDRDAVWEHRSVLLDSYAGQVIHILVEAADEASASTVDAGIDDIAINVIETPEEIFVDDFEADQDWVVNAAGTDTATDGKWEWGEPEPTTNYGVQQLGYTVSGRFGLTTELQGGNYTDLDGGVTSIRSPDFLLPILSTGESLETRFYYYLAHTTSATNDDYIRVSVIGASGSTVLFEDFGNNVVRNGVWRQQIASLDAYAGEQVYLLIEAADEGSASLLEAGIDNVEVLKLGNGPSSGLYGVSINAPSDNSSYTYGDNVTFSGSATVPSGATDESANIQWSSNRNGYLGGGASVSLSTLAVGGHTITAAVGNGTDPADKTSITVTINSDNVPPVAVDDTGSTSTNVPITLPVLANDTDANGHSLTISDVTQGANGTVTFTDGTVIYTPNNGFSGIDSFTYTADDYWWGYDTATVAISVSSTVNVALSTVFIDDFESDLGWVVNPLSSDTATKGMWERGDPSLVEYYGVKQPGDTVSGTHGLITGPQYSANAGYGTYDIDGGVTSIRSPDIALPTLAVGESLELDYDFFFSHNHNKSTADDYLKVTVVGASGSTVVQEEQGLNMDRDAVWEHRSVLLDSYAGQVIHILVEAADEASASTVDAGIDDIAINVIETPEEIFVDDFETNQGWVVNAGGTDTATDGKWEWGDPEPTQNYGVQQLGYTVSGQFGLTTELQGGNYTDLDGGVTSIRSPDILLPALSTGENLEARFYYYLSHTTGATSDDYIRVSVVGASGITILFEDFGDSIVRNGVWRQQIASLDAYAGEQVYLLIEAADEGTASLLEAGIDNVEVFRFGGSSSNGGLDGDGDGVVGSLDLCPSTPANETVDSDGCADSQKDTDTDGITDNLDQCPATPAGEAVDTNGCADSQKDTDADGVMDNLDQCPATPAGEAVDTNGCADSQKDTDADGVMDNLDQCPATPAGEAVDTNGCGDSQKDTDADGVMDNLDQCPATPAGEAVDTNGCADSQKDTDTDGITDNLDQCLATPAGAAVDANGCADSQKDTDADGVTDNLDQCPATPTNAAVDANGCADSQKDTDADGVADSLDQCPTTPANEAVDATGCPVSTDDDNDGVLNANDQCPATEPNTPVGADGCDPTQRDTDGDGILDINDAFPNDPSESNDLDGDGIGDNADTDRDGDGVPNATDLFPDNSSESTDLDNDGIGDNADTDRDGDGVPNEQDAFPDDVARSTLPTITIDTPTTLTTVGASPVHITGTVEGSPISLTVNSAPVAITNGAFQADVALEEGFNTITARMENAEGIVSTASISVSMDLTPPYLTIESHEDAQIVHTDSVTITGLVNDIVRGTIEDDQAVVTVNGVTASIANRSFMAQNVPLQTGNNTITVQGVDQVGNSGQYSISLTYQPLVGRYLEIVGGQNQSAAINSELAAPLSLKVLDDADQPVANKNVVFRVIQGSGQVGMNTPLEGQGYLATTDSNGIATTEFRLGQRAGTGNHKVRARVVGWEDEAIFYATATTALGNKLSVNTGNNQRGGIHQPLPAPFVVAVTDEGANVVHGARVRFDVSSGGGHFQNDTQSIEVLTDSDGRATAHMTLGAVTGLDKQRVTATLLDVQLDTEGGTPIITSGFTASGFVPGDPGQTTISGVVLDNQDNPLPGVTVRVDHTTRQAVADAEGQFKIENVPVGPVHLIADGSTATVEGEFPALSYNIVTVSGVDNPLSAPIYMVKLNMETAKWAGAEDVVITLPEVPGFKLEIPAGSVTFPDDSTEGFVSVTAVNSSKVPMAPPNGMQPQFIVTIQPTGALFDAPAKLTLPNVDSHVPGAQVEMFSYDHDLEEFVAIGLGTVSKDGTTITTNPGVGVVKAGWHCGAQPNSSGACSSDDCSAGGAQCAPGGSGGDPDEDCEGTGGDSDATQGNPINITNGNKFQRETDYVGTGVFPLIVERNYNSQFNGWRHSYQFRMATMTFQELMLEVYGIDLFKGPTFSAGSGGGGGGGICGGGGGGGGGTATIALPVDPPQFRVLYTPTGKARVFSESEITPGEWTSTAEPYSVVTFELNQTIYYNKRNGKKLYFDTAGRIVRIEHPDGFYQTVQHTQNTAIVTDTLGNSLTITLGGTGQMTKAQINGLVFNYQYGENGQITKAIYPGGKFKLYHYENGKFSRHLTGITDESGNRFATWQYDKYGRAILSEHANGAERVIIKYNDLQKESSENVIKTFSATTGDDICSGSSGTVSPFGGSNFKNLHKKLEEAPEIGSVTVTNELGKTTTYFLEKIAGDRKIVRVDGAPTASCAGANREKTYYSDGLLQSKTDWQGNTTSYNYNSDGQVSSMTEAEGSAVARTNSTSWHADYKKVTQRSEPGRTVSNTYNTEGLVETRTVGNRVWTYDYYPTGLLQSIDGPRTDVTDLTSFNYDNNGRLITVTNALGQKVNLSNFNGWNLPQQMVDANGVMSELGYDGRGRLTSRTVKSRDGDAVTTFTVDDVGQITAITLPELEGGNRAVLNYEYDASHRLVAMSNERGERIEYTLDPMGNRVQETIKNGSSAVVYTHTRLFDELGRLLKDIGAEGQTTDYQYDVNDNNTGITDARGSQTQQAFDALNRLNEITNPYSDLVQFSYDGRDNLTSVTDQRGFTTQYNYNEHNQVTQLTSPDTGTSNFTYDKAGNIATATDARSIVAEYSYDALNRVISREYISDSSRNISYSYDQHNIDPAAPDAEYNAGKGRLTSFTDNSGSTSYRYNDRGNLVEDSRTIDNLSGQSQTYISGYQYDLADNLIGITYPDGTQISYSRNTLGEITGISAALPAEISPTQPVQTLANNVSYQPFGGIKALTWGNGLTLQRNFDNDYRIDQQIISGVQSLSYGYDQLSNITSITDAIDAHNTGSYDYDLLNRMVEETKADYANSFDYDEVGNRTEQTNNNLVAQDSDTETHTYGNTNNRLISKNGVTQSYDQVGNIINNGTYGFNYDVANRMAEVTQAATPIASYTHNALGQRVAKTRPDNANAHSTAYIYNPAGQLISETTYNSTGIKQETKHYVWLGTVPVAMLQTIKAGQSAANDEQVIYLHTDHLGTPRKATNQTQQVVWHWLSDAFGKTAANDDVDGDAVATVINLRFPGQYYDGETELHYNYFRDYDPGMGRYVQSDPIGLLGGVNIYGYVMANPQSYIDPYGLFLCDLLSNLGDTEVNIGLTFGAGLSFSEGITLSSSGLTGSLSVGVGAGLSGKLGTSGPGASTNLWNESTGDTGRNVNVDTSVSVTAGVGGVGGSLTGKVGTSGASASVDAGLVGGASFHTGIGVSGKFLDCSEEEEPDC